MTTKEISDYQFTKILGDYIRTHSVKEIEKFVKKYIKTIK